MLSLRIRPELFLRTPLWPFARYGTASPDALLQEADFRLALFLASPAFYRVLEAKCFDPLLLTAKERLTLQKYHNRLCFRPTPFGLFSAFTLTAWGDDEKLVLNAEKSIHVLPDQELAAILGKSLAADPSQGIYTLNPTLYLLGSEYRFILTAQEENSTRLRYSLELLEVNPLTRKLVDWLRPAGRTGPAIVAFVIQQTGCPAEEARDYFVFLRNSGVLFSSLDANLVGQDYSERTNQQLPEMHAAALPQTAQQISTRLADRGLAQPGNYFYVNTERKAARGSVPGAYRAQLAEALEALQHLALPAAPALLGRFIKDFSARFDQARVPLLQAMDPDAGVGYGDLAQQAASPSLVRELHFPVAETQAAGTAWSPVHRLLLAKWTAAGTGSVIRLTSEELSALGPADHLPLPPGLPVMFRITGSGLLIENAGGVTANGLTGRFTAVSAETAAAARRIAQAEQEANPGVVFAEISALSDRYTDNVNRRRHLYAYEIPINTISTLPPAQQLLPGDLQVCVCGGEVVLESLRLKKRVIPRLSSAYNFRHNHLALFRFLCDLQYQSLQTSLAFDLADFFPGMDHYPRVQFHDAILSPAKWRIREALPELTAEALRAKLGLPAWIALSRYDQQLVFNLDDPGQFQFFRDCTRGMSDFELREFLLPGKEALVTTAAGQPLVSQLIAFLVNPETVYHALPVEIPAGPQVQREFVPGSEWLYLKIYGNPNSADDLLVSRVLPVVRKLMKGKDRSWFFIRYQDPGPHIRLRIRLPEQQAGNALQMLKQQFAGLVSGQLVREYQADTYRRELERYGPDMIGLAESFFRVSSDLVLGFLSSNQQERYPADQLAAGTFGILLDLLLPGLPGQVAFLASVSAGFQAEFNGGKALRVELDQLYRGSAKLFAEWISDRNLYRDLRLQGALRRFEAVIGKIRGRMRGFRKERYQALLADLLHLHLNRVYASNQRQQEYVLYYCFHKYKCSRQALEKRSASLPEMPFS